jgi:hypothetical protein
MTALDLLPHLQAAAAPDPELERKQYEAALVARVRAAAIEECQRELRALAATVERALPGAVMPMIFVAAYRGAADHLEALRT